MSAPSVEPGLEGLVALAVTDLAELYAVAPETVVVVRAEIVIWPDGATGCPEPGRVYPQIRLEGARIVLALDGVEHHFHVSERRPLFRCPHPDRRLLGIRAEDPDDWDPALD